MKYLTYSRAYDLRVGNKVLYNGQVFTISRMYIENGASASDPTLELVHLKLDSNRPLAVPASRVTKCMSEGHTLSTNSSMLYD